MEKDLTKGGVLKNIIIFALPYLLSYFLQTFYGLADLFIIGRFGGVKDTTAVSVGSQVMHMVTVMIVGLAMGSTVAISRAIGGRLREKAARAVGNTVTLFMLLSIAVTVILLLLVKPIVSVMSTPAEAVKGTVEYLVVCFIGIPFITAYNIIGSVFRGLGDTKTPMYFIAVACAVNVALDYVFIGALGMGPLGAALGTTVAQSVSVIVSLIVVIKRKKGFELAKSDFKPDRQTVRQILKVGIPVAVQDGFVQIAFIIITVIANRRGLDDAAAVGIVEKVIGVLFLVPSSMLSTVSALSAQNFGAGEPRRARLTLWYAVIIAVGFGVISATVVFFVSRPVVGLFSDDKTVIEMGGQYLRGYVWDCVFAGMHFCFSGYFCACEKSLLSFLHNFLAIVCVRVPCAYFLSAAYPSTLFPMGLASPAASLLSALVCVMAYIVIRRAENKKAALADDI